MNLIIFSSILSLIEAIQALLFVRLWGDISPFVTFLIFVAFVILGQCAALWLLPRRWEQESFRKSSRLYLYVEGVLLALLLSASYKLVIYDFQPQLAHRGLIAVMVLAVLNKIFWKQVNGFLILFYAFLADPANKTALSLLADAGFVVFIAFFIYVPDAHAVMARMFLSDDFHHWDLFMAPAWGYLKGCLPYVDIISQYGVGIPLEMGVGSRLLGGFNYENLFMLLVWVCIIYYVAAYVFLRSWLKSVPLVIIAMLIGLKTQMFHTGIAPFVFTYPSCLVLRNFWDVLFFLCIWGHLLTGRRLLLWAAALLSVLAEFNLVDTGVYLIGAFYVYLILICLMPDLRERFLMRRWAWVEMAGCAICVPLGVLGLFYAVVGQHTFTKLFWDNMAEYIVYFLAGHGTVPYSESFHYHFFWAAAMGLAVPLVYLASIMILGLLCYWRKIHASHVLVIVLCFYGLGLYHYYVARTAVTSYYVSGLPFIFVVCFWLQKCLERTSDQVRKKMLLSLSLFAWFCLWTNHQVLAYPNIFNISRNPMVDPLVTLPGPERTGYINIMFMKYGKDYKLPINSLGEKDEWLFTQKDFTSDDELKALYDHEFNFSEDAQLIDSLTGPNEKVPVLSSFETKMEMQADRKPFFYFSPFLSSVPMRMRIFPAEAVHSAAYLKKTLRQLREEKPSYIFMERILLSQTVPPAYQDDVPRLLVLVKYIRDLYEPFKYGKYLVAMKRK